MTTKARTKAKFRAKSLQERNLKRARTYWLERMEMAPDHELTALKLAPTEYVVGVAEPGYAVLFRVDGEMHLRCVGRVLSHNAKVLHVHPGSTLVVGERYQLTKPHWGARHTGWPVIVARAVRAQRLPANRTDAGWVLWNVSLTRAW